MRITGPLLTLLTLLAPSRDLEAQISALPEPLQSGLASPDPIAVEAARAQLIVEREEHRSAVVAALGVDHLRSRLRVEELLDQLSDPRWTMRERAESELIALGGEGLEAIRERARLGTTLEERLRAGRVLTALETTGARGGERKVRILAALAESARDFEPGEDLRAALSASIRHPVERVRMASLRSLGVHASADQYDLVLQPLLVEDAAPGIRASSLAALADSPVLLAAFLDRVTEKQWSPRMRLRLYRGTTDPDLRRRLAEGDTRLSAIEALPPLATSEAAPDGPNETRVACRVLQAEGPTLDGRFVGVAGDELLLAPLDREAGSPMRVRFERRPTCLFAGDPEAMSGVRVYLRQGSVLQAAAATVSDGALSLQGTLFGDREIPLQAVQALSLSPSTDESLTAVFGVDVLRLTDGQVVRGTMKSLDAERCEWLDQNGETMQVERERVDAVLLRRDVAAGEDRSEATRIDLRSGDRLLALLGSADDGSLSVFVDGLGALRIPSVRVERLEFEVRSGAAFGYTLVANYSQDEVLELDSRGRRRFVLEDVYAVWDVESLPSGNLLITETSSNRVVEVDRETGAVIWEFTDLHNPYDADRLPNGNTLIADSLNLRVIEVSNGGEIVWEAKGFSATDVDRLPDGRTLIADDADRRVVEVDSDGKVLWQIEGLTAIRDADRLSNGNTLVTLYSVNQVVEFDREGRRVFEIDGLSSPSDADRLPNGNTLVAESGQVREFDRQGKEVWRADVEWATEVNRY